MQGQGEEPNLSSNAVVQAGMGISGWGDAQLSAGTCLSSACEGRVLLAVHQVQAGQAQLVCNPQGAGQ